MKTHKKFTDSLLLFLGIFLSGLVASATYAQTSDLHVPEISGDSEAEIRIYDFESFRPYLNRDNDTVYVINFWATWCKPCVKELPYFERINKEFKESPVRVMLVSLDFPGQVENRLIPFVKENDIKSEVIVLHDPDANSWINIVDEGWSGAIPATLFYSSENRDFFEKSFTYEELLKVIEQNLKVL